MNFIKSDVFKKYFLPGFVFQSIIIGGGYGTGREIVEFFLSFGVLGGLIGMVAIYTLVSSVICVATFEFARVFKAYNYRAFFSKLLGKFWVIYEICYSVLLLIVLAVISDASGILMHDLVGLPRIVGTLIMILGVGYLVVAGTESIEKFLSYWSLLLYAIYAVFLFFVFTRYGSQISNAVSGGKMLDGWQAGAMKFGFYNLGTIPAVLFALTHIETRKEAIGSGLVAGIVGAVPAVLLFLGMSAFYPSILSQAVPTTFVLNELGIDWLRLAFQIILFGTLIETSTGLIFAITERIRASYEDRKVEMPKHIVSVVTVLLLVSGILISRFGIINLIAKGYGLISWGFLATFIIPILTIGMWKAYKKAGQ